MGRGCETPEGLAARREAAAARPGATTQGWLARPVLQRWQGARKRNAALERVAAGSWCRKHAVTPLERPAPAHGSDFCTRHAVGSWGQICMHSSNVCLRACDECSGRYAASRTTCHRDSSSGTCMVQNALHLAHGQAVIYQHIISRTHL